MEADCGIYIVKVKELKENWSKLKTTLIGYAENITNSTSKWVYDSEKSEAGIMLNILEKLPNKVETLTDIQIQELLKPFGNYDTPYLLENNFIFSYGDNLGTVPTILAESLEVLKTTKVEIWN